MIIPPSDRTEPVPLAPLVDPLATTVPLLEPLAEPVLAPLPTVVPLDPLAGLTLPLEPLAGLTLPLEPLVGVTLPLVTGVPLLVPLVGLPLLPLAPAPDPEELWVCPDEVPVVTPVGVLLEEKLQPASTKHTSALDFMTASIPPFYTQASALFA